MSKNAKSDQDLLFLDELDGPPLDELDDVGLDDEAFGLFDGKCAACDAYGPVDDLSLCEECSDKLDRDMIRQRDWEYSVTAWICPEEHREELWSRIIEEYGAKLELIAPSKKQKRKKAKK